MFKFLPAPKSVEYGSNSYAWNSIEALILPNDHSYSLLQAALTLADDFEKSTGRRIRFATCQQPSIPAITLSIGGTPKGIDAYSLDATVEGIAIEAKDEAGVFYGIQTLRQMLAAKLTHFPETHIRDFADYPARGFYHDVTRGAIPTMETLFQLVDKMAYYKMNHLQLYVEHTYAFAKHFDICEGADPLTAEEILRLQEYCIERHVELVPSISTFGHFYMALRSKRLEDLNELDVKGGDRPFSFFDRMAHYTLNPSDKRSIELIREILSDYVPLFKSNICNICCDETFDLGKGKSKAIATTPADVKKLYVSFLKKIIGIVKELGKTAMFWGDIIGEEPELVNDLPEDVIPAEWDYGPEANRRDTESLVKSGRKFYVCPGTSSWNCWLANSHIAQQNMLNYALKGLKYGAIGYLNTNWGDYGNINLPATSWYGLIYGAACSWNANGATNLEETENAIDFLEFGADGLCALWREFGRNEIVAWGHIQLLVDPSPDIPECEYSIGNYKAENVANAFDMLRVVFDKMELCLNSAKPQDPFAIDEIRLGARMSLLMHEIFVAFLTKNHELAWKIADELRRYETIFCRYWHRRNKPSEYYRVKQIILAVARKLDEF